MWSEKYAPDRIRVLQCTSNYQESEAITTFLQEIKKKKASHTVAILYRAHYQSRSIEEALIRHNIPYTIIGGIAFYERKEIKDILAYLRLITNPYDRISCARILNIPLRGLGKKFEEDVFTLWDKEPLFTFIDILKSSLEYLPLQKQIAVTNFLELFKEESARYDPVKPLNN